MTEMNAGDVIQQLALTALTPSTPRPAPRVVTSPAPKRKEFHDEPIIAGETLENYTHRIAAEDGLTVKIVSHTEHLEKVEQPPTPEEIEAEKVENERVRQQDILLAKIFGGVLAFGIGVFGIVAYSDSRRQARVIRENSENP